MNYEEIKATWNAQADEYNQWDELSEVEKIEFAALAAADKERPSRIRAQEEVRYLKERIASAGAEQRRAVREAVLQEREECAKVCDELEALQAQREPLSDAQICDALGIDGSDDWTYAVEAAHGITSENRHAEQDFGIPQGQELL